MSIQIPLVLALLSQKSRKNYASTPVKSLSDNQMMVVNNKKPIKRTNLSISDNSLRKLKGVAQIVGGTKGAKISRAANVLGAVQKINTPAGALSLIMQNNNPVLNANPIMKQNPSNLYGNINSMLSNMDSKKKEELMGMAQSLLGNMK